MRRSILAVLVFVLLLSWSPATAQDGRGNPWDRMKRFDANNDGKITREEFKGPERYFNRFDSDKDGVLTEEEVKSGRRGGGGGMGSGRMGGGGGVNAERVDKNKDGAISADEWQAFFDAADENGDGILQKEEWEAVTSGRRMKDSAPQVGDRAPSVAAKPMGGGAPVDLSKPERVTVLIFGSYT